MSILTFRGVGTKMVFQVSSNPNNSISSGEAEIQIFVVYFLNFSKSCDLLQENWTSHWSQSRTGILIFFLSEFLYGSSLPGFEWPGCNFLPALEICDSSQTSRTQKNSSRLQDQPGRSRAKRNKTPPGAEDKSNQMEQSWRQVWQN